MGNRESIGKMCGSDQCAMCVRLHVKCALAVSDCLGRCGITITTGMSADCKQS